MLQQTQVATVIPYYARFLERFPDVRSLAKAPEDEVFRYWAGLGYYRRARQLHSAAKCIVQQHGGEFPKDLPAMLALPGIGRYTACAILSFAYDLNHGIVEANTQRLYARLLYWKDPLQTTKSQNALWEFAEGLVPKKGTGTGQINQAVMEIGSQICTPNQPQCDRCPLVPFCPTSAKGHFDRIPAPKPPKIITELREAAVLIEQDGRWLMRRCQTGERWAGLWDFPRFDITGCDSEASARNALARSVLDRFQLSIDVEDCVHSLKHAVTRYRITLHCYDAKILGRRKTSPSVRSQAGVSQWCDLAQMEELALSSSGKRVLRWLKKRSHATTE
jgi:A/G-specific adenine glycosylase